MSKHKDKDKERSRDDRRSRERERSREKEHRKRSRSKERRSHKKSKDKERSRRSRSRKSSRRDRSRDRDRYSRRSRSKDRRSRSRSSHRRRRSNSPKAVDVSAAQHAQISQLIMSSLTGNATSQPTFQTSILGQPPALLPQPTHAIRTDFSNLFQSSANEISISSTVASTNSSARAIAAAKAQELLRAKNLNLSDALKSVNNSNSVTSNGNEMSRDADEFRAMLNAVGDMSGGIEETSNSGDRKKKKKSRWATTNDATEGKTFIPGMPTILPSNLNADQQEAYLVQLQIEEISRKLRTGDLGVSANPEERSPSPEPVYSSDGKRLNTREFRTRKKLEEQRHMLITRMQCMNPEFKPPSDYKPPVLRVSDKVLIPQEEHPDINFVGLLIGPRGNTLKAMEKETGAKIIIRGKGSVKEGKVGRKDGQPLPGEDEPLHAFITAGTPESVKKAVDKIKEVITQGIEVPEGCNDLRRMQLRELAQLNGTLRETDGMRCSNCGSTEHKSWLCPDKPNVTNNIVCSACGGAGHIAKDCKSKRPGLGGVEGSNNQAKIDEEYMSLMAELGEVQPEAAQPREPQPPPSRPYNIFDTPRHQQQPRAIGPPPSQPPHAHVIPNNPLPSMAGPPPPAWHHQNHQPALPHPMGSYPPPPQMNSHGWPQPMPPLPPGQINQPPIPIMHVPPPNVPGIPPPAPGTELSPPGTEIEYKNPWSAPPLPPGNYWNHGNDTQPPLPSFLPPPPPPE